MHRNKTLLNDGCGDALMLEKTQSGSVVRAVGPGELFETCSSHV